MSPGTVSTAGSEWLPSYPSTTTTTTTHACTVTWQLLSLESPSYVKPEFLKPQNWWSQGLRLPRMGQSTEHPFWARPAWYLRLLDPGSWKRAGFVNLFVFSLCTGVLPTRMSAHHTRECSQRPKEFTGSSRIGANVCLLSCGCWEPNQGPPERELVLLGSEPSLQPLKACVCSYRRGFSSSGLAPVIQFIQWSAKG